MEPFSFPCSASVNHLTTQSSQNIDLSGGCSQVTGESSSKQRRQWSPKEDVLLISAWLNTSKDPIVSNEQKCGTFWKRIQVYFNASALPAGIAPRELIQCKQRWARINELVCKLDLRARFAIVKKPALLFDKAKIGKIMRACIILHNMIVEDERDGYNQYDITDFVDGESSRSSQVDFSYSTDMPSNLGNMLGIRNQIRDQQKHLQLKADLVENIWQKFGHLD